MKSRIFLTSLEMVVDLFMTWINNVADLKLKRKNFKLLWRRQKLLLKWKKTRCLEHSWNLVKSDRILTGVLLKRKMNSITPEATLEMEENKVLRAQLELGQVRQDIDR